MWLLCDKDFFLSVEGSLGIVVPGCSVGRCSDLWCCPPALGGKVCSWTTRHLSGQNNNHRLCQQGDGARGSSSSECYFFSHLPWDAAMGCPWSNRRTTVLILENFVGDFLLLFSGFCQLLGSISWTLTALVVFLAFRMPVLQKRRAL